MIISSVEVIISYVYVADIVSVQAYIKENIKAPRDWPVWGESTGDRCIPHTKTTVTWTRDVFVVSLKKLLNKLSIRDARTVIWRRRNL